MSRKLHFGKVAGNGKAILFAAGIATIAVTSAFLCGGCGDLLNPDNNTHESTDRPGDYPPDTGTKPPVVNPPDTGTKPPGGGSGLAGDWAFVKEEVSGGNVYNTPDYYKMFYSFKSSNNGVITELQKISDFWIERTESAEYKINGDSVCIIYTEYEYEDCFYYNISGNTLTTIGQGNSEGSSNDCAWDPDDEGFECPPPPPPPPPTTYTMTFVRANLAAVKDSLGKVYSRNPALYDTKWMKPSESGSEKDIIVFGDDHYDGDQIYVSKFYGSDLYISDSDEGTVWYTEGSRLTLVGLECAKYEYLDRWDRDVCVSYSATKTVSLEYILANGNLRLRPAGSTGTYDVWTPYSYNNINHMSKANAKFKESERTVNPFKAFRQ